MSAPNPEAARLRAWLSRIVARCRGMAVGMALQALESPRWPDGPRGIARDRDRVERRRKPR